MNTNDIIIRREAAKKYGCKAVCFEGNILFYGKSGEYETPKPYFVGLENPDDFEQYDKTFPEKEKLKLEGQLQ